MNEKKQFMRNMGERIKQARLDAGLTQEKLAELLNLSRGTIARYELGEIEPKLQNLAAIADVLQVSVDYLMGRKGKCLGTEEFLSEKAIHTLDAFIREVRRKDVGDI